MSFASCAGSRGHSLPFRYRELERLATFQNRLLGYGLTFVDIAGKTPFDPDLFVALQPASPDGQKLSC
jgi:hypothetical protein